MEDSSGATLLGKLQRSLSVRHHQYIILIFTEASRKQQQDLIRQAWSYNALAEGIPVLFVMGMPVAMEHTHSDVIPVAAPDRPACSVEKLKACFEYALRHWSFDYIIKAGDEAFFHVPGLKQFFPHAPFIAARGSFDEEDEIEACYFLNRDAVSIIVNQLDSYKRNPDISADRTVFEILLRNGLAAEFTDFIRQAQNFSSFRLVNLCRSGNAGVVYKIGSGAMKRLIVASSRTSRMNLIGGSLSALLLLVDKFKLRSTEHAKSVIKNSYYRKLDSVLSFIYKNTRSCNFIEGGFYDTEAFSEELIRRTGFNVYVFDPLPARLACKRALSFLLKEGKLHTFALVVATESAEVTLYNKESDAIETSSIDFSSWLIKTFPQKSYLVIAMQLSHAVLSMLTKALQDGSADRISFLYLYFPEGLSERQLRYEDRDVLMKLRKRTRVITVS